MKIRCIVQSRLSSTRLPAKALLPIAGYPSVVLAGLRASNLNHEVIVATSTHYSDDIIVKALNQYGINCIRGSLNDVLFRYIQATVDLKNNDLVVRLTADNVFPDGAFIEDLLSLYLKKRSEYLTVSLTKSNLPYGLSAEIFSVELLRLAHKNAKTQDDREHVTSWIEKNISKKDFYINPNSRDNLSQFRCTLDTLHDYWVLQKIFEEVSDPIKENVFSLCERLTEFRKEHQKNEIDRCHFSLGSAQLGMNYGIANQVGMPEESVAINIIQQAIDKGVVTIDTARAYGKAEERIAKALSGFYKDRAAVITKLHVGVLQSEMPSESEIFHAVDANVFRSCATLNRTYLDTLLLHDPSDRFRFNGKIWQRLLQLKQEGYIKKLGISVYSIEDAITGIEDPQIEHIQLPLNILDSRWKQSNLERNLAKRKNIEIFVRSALLQGLLTMDPKFWPNISHKQALAIFNDLNDLVRQFNRESILDLCFAYLRSISWVSSIIIGVDSIEQLNENIVLFKMPLLSKQQMQIIEMKFSGLPNEFLNPQKWQVA